ncbi:Uncharacterised protein [Vibrio cholerae]|nr:Uncharacterised protein [Vibrio cholerae]
MIRSSEWKTFKNFTRACRKILSASMRMNSPTQPM